MWTAINYQDFLSENQSKWTEIISPTQALSFWASLLMRCAWRKLLCNMLIVFVLKSQVCIIRGVAVINCKLGFIQIPSLPATLHHFCPPLCTTQEEGGVRHSRDSNSQCHCKSASQWLFRNVWVTSLRLHLLFYTSSAYNLMTILSSLYLYLCLFLNVRACCCF